jgi:hypothetical protein
VSATKGKVTATVSWDEHPLPEADTNIRLHVDRAGTVVADGVEVVPDDAFASVIPTSTEPPAVAVSDLDADGKTEVLVSTFTGGAHCCWETRIFPAPDYKGPPSTYAFRGNPWRLRDLGRGDKPDLTLAAATEDFVDVSHAATGRALVILNYANGRFLDVTARFKKRLKRDAKANKKEWLAHGRGDTEAQGALAAYVADLKRLGRETKAEEEIQRAGKRQQLPDGTLGFHKDLAKLMKALRAGRSSPFAHNVVP